MELFDQSFTFLLAFAIVLPLGLLALVVLVLAGGRDIDPTGKRTVVLYVAVVSFIAIFTALIASTVVVAALTEKIENDGAAGDILFEDEFEDFDFDEFEDGSDVSQNDRVLQGVVQGALVLLAAGIVLVFHHRRRREYLAAADFPESAAWRTDRAYIYAVCFTAILIVLFAAGFGSYNIFQLIGPGVFGSGDDEAVRDTALRGLITLAWLAVAAFGIFRYSWLQAHPRQPVGDRSDPTAEGATP
jgi:hypothetical protein